jgi:predicted porin
MGALLLHGLGTMVQFGKDGTTTTLRTGDAGLTYQATPALRLSAGYSYTRSSGRHWQQGSLSADYFLSKRTDVYCHLAMMLADTESRAALFPLLPSSSSSQTVASAGIRHVF